MKRVLITGADGFIGGHCLRRLRVLADDLHAATINEISRYGPGDVHWHQVDLLDREQLTGLFETVRPTHLLHLGWHVETGMQLNAHENFNWVKSGIDLLELFHHNGGQRVVVSGSCAEYDWRYAFLSEQLTPALPTSLYGSTKHALQTLFAAYSRVHALSYAWARIFFTFGPYEKPNRLVPSVIRSLLQRKEAQCSHGEQIRDYLYVIDVADALVTLLDSSLEGPINIGSGEPIKIKQMVWWIADIMGKKRDLIRLGAIPHAEGEPPVIIADVNRLKNELKWQPKYDLKTALAESISWWDQIVDGKDTEL